jgi:hypothetical protein
MIIARINPARVESVDIVAESDLMEDFDLAVYPLIRRHLHALDQELRKLTSEVLGEKAEDENP